jgi:hypothetical protein
MEFVDYSPCRLYLARICGYARRLFTSRAGNSSFPFFLTGIYPMPDPESQVFTFRRLFEEPFSQLPTWSPPIPDQIGLDPMPTPHAPISLLDTCLDNMDHRQSVHVTDPSITLPSPPWIHILREYRGDGTSASLPEPCQHCLAYEGDCR